MLWKKIDTNLILASQSPRRKTILAQMALDFTVSHPDVEDENSFLDGADLPGSLQRLEVAKARSIADLQEDALVLGADTVVALDGRILGKPADRVDAFRMIDYLAGRTHEVLTGVALVRKSASFEVSAVARTQVTFRPIPADEIENYLDRAAYRDKAGAYGVQDDAMVFVDSINGCFYNVMGLPVSATIRLFEQYRLKG